MLLNAIMILTMLCSMTISASIGWLWLPVAFAGCLLLFVALAVLFLWGACQFIDLKKPRTEDSPFYRELAAVYIEALISIVQAKVHTKGLENTPKEGRFLLVCNHQFIADPGILLHYFKDSQLAFISKKENQRLFVVGKIMHAMLGQPLNRENDREALKTILTCIDILKEDKASIAVFPEGGTSKDGKLHPFRHGAFKIAQRAKVPIVVCTINNTRPLLSNALRLRSTDVELHLVRVIQPEEFAGMKSVQLGEWIYQMMLDDLGPDFALEE